MTPQRLRRSEWGVLTSSDLARDPLGMSALLVVVSKSFRIKASCGVRACLKPASEGGGTELFLEILEFPDADAVQVRQLKKHLDGVLVVEQ